MFGDPLLLLIGCVYLIPAVIVAVPAHELGHAFAAMALGDTTPRDRGYLRPDPGRFFNVYGVLAAFLANVTWGTPVPVSESRLRDPVPAVVYALGGPAANLLLAVVFGLPLRLLGLSPIIPTEIRTPTEFGVEICFAIFFLNLSTFAFQLLPIPGLDGWRVIEGLFRRSSPRFFYHVAANTQTIWLVAIGIIFIGPFLLHFSILGLAVELLFKPASLAIAGYCAPYVALDPCQV